MSTRTYNPIGCSPKQFFSKFADCYEKWNRYDFCNFDLKDTSTEKLMEDGEIESLVGMEDDYLGKVIVSRCSKTFEFSRDKKARQGSVVIVAMEARDHKKMLKRLEKMTSMKLKEVSRD